MLSNINIQNLFFAPQAIMLVMVCVLLLVAAFFPRSKGWVYLFSQLTLLLTIYAVLYDNRLYHSTAVLPGALRQFALIFVLVLVSICFVFAREYNDENRMPRHEFFILGLLSTLGMIVLILANNLLSAYLGIELMSLPIVAMIAMKRVKPRCLEASMKYFVMSAVGSGLLLYGFSFLFGITHQFQLKGISDVLLTQSHSTVLLWVAVSSVLAGLLFKLGVAPFHSWVADVYDGAPNSVTLFMSTGPKVAIMVFLLIFLGGLHAQSSIWQTIVIVAAMLSIALGNLVAIVQTNLKRMLAYSSVAHMGFLLLGVYGITASSSTELTLSPSMIFYILSYSTMSLAAFGLLVALSRMGKKSMKSVAYLVWLTVSLGWLF